VTDERAGEYHLPPQHHLEQRVLLRVLEPRTGQPDAQHSVRAQHCVDAGPVGATPATGPNGRHLMFYDNAAATTGMVIATTSSATRRQLLRLNGEIGPLSSRWTSTAGSRPGLVVTLGKQIVDARASPASCIRAAWTFTLYWPIRNSRTRRIATTTLLQTVPRAHWSTRADRGALRDQNDLNGRQIALSACSIPRCSHPPSTRGVSQPAAVGPWPHLWRSRCGVGVKRRAARPAGLANDEHSNRPPQRGVVDYCACGAPGRREYSCEAPKWLAPREGGMPDQDASDRRGVGRGLKLQDACAGTPRR